MIDIIMIRIVNSFIFHNCRSSFCKFWIISSRIYFALANKVLHLLVNSILFLTYFEFKAFLNRTWWVGNNSLIFMLPDEIKIGHTVWCVDSVNKIGEYLIKDAVVIANGLITIKEHWVMSFIVRISVANLVLLRIIFTIQEIDDISDFFILIIDDGMTLWLVLHWFKWL